MNTGKAGELAFLFFCLIWIQLCSAWLSALIISMIVRVYTGRSWWPF